LFFIAIGPVVYDTTIKRKQEEAKLPKREEVGKIEDDKYTKMLKQIKIKEIEKEMEKKEGEEEKVLPQNAGKITFEEYEAFLRRLEKDNKLN